MNSILTISTPATSRALLTEAELRTIAGVTDASRDTELAEAGLRAADIIAEHCLVGGDGVTPVTLLRETLVETFRLRRSTEMLILARRFLGTVSVVEDGTTLEATDFAIQAGAGILTRLRDDEPCWWTGRKIVVTYQAGFAEPPSALKEAATRILRLNLSGTSRDPLVKRERIDVDGIEATETEFWVGPVTGGAIPTDVADILRPYMNNPVV